MIYVILNLAGINPCTALLSKLLLFVPNCFAYYNECSDVDNAANELVRNEMNLCVYSMSVKQGRTFSCVMFQFYSDFL